MNVALARNEYTSAKSNALNSKSENFEAVSIALKNLLEAMNNLKDAKKCETLKTPKGEWIIYKGTNKGQKTQDLLPNICEQAIKRLNLPRSMRWHDGEHDFIRPVHWLVAILGS